MIKFNQTMLGRTVGTTEAELVISELKNALRKRMTIP